ncbi:MAG: hypothetical protein HC860_17785 [Alkalinema sp. RU_4_3]|nr:hypothetical protein [Alkalinema sp. RU_4_3]
MTDLISSFDALKAQLHRETLPFREVEGEPAVTLPTRLGDADSVLHIRWEPTPGVVQFIQPLPMTVPVDRRSDVGARSTGSISSSPCSASPMTGRPGTSPFAPRR